MNTTPKFNPWITALASVAGLVIPVWLLLNSGDAGCAPVKALFSGWVFTERSIITGGALDQPSLHKELFILCYSLIVLCPALAFIRWLNDCSGLMMRRLLALASLLVLVHPFSILTLFTYDVSRYVAHMGRTPMRLVAFLVAFAGYVLLALFAAWLCRLTIRRPAQRETTGTPS